MKLLEIGFQTSEFLAALVGIICIAKYRVTSLSTRYFVYYLCLSFVVDIFGNLPTLIFKFDKLSFLKDTFLYKNAWLYNSYTVISILFFIFYFRSNLTNKKFRNILSVSAILFFISSIFNFLLTDVFFSVHSSFLMMIGTFLILLSVFFYFFEMLRSEKILEFNKDLVFYVAVGSTVFHLCVTPLFIYSNYYSNSISSFFVEVRQVILYSAIIFMYTCFTFGLIICLRKNKSY